MRGALLFGGLCLWHAVMLVSWLHRDQRPVRWDSAVHISTAWDYKEAAAAGSVLDLLKTHPRPGHPPYPPLAHYAMIPFMAVAQWTGGSVEDAAASANLLFIGLLAAGAWVLASWWWGGSAGLSAAFLVSLTPPIFLYAREILVDVALTACVVWAYACWCRSGHFRDRRWTAALGAACGLGMLTKWTFFIYAAPVLWDAIHVLLKGPRENRRTALLGLWISALLMLPWYAVNVVTALPRLSRVAGQGGGEGDPAVFSLDSWLWYPRILSQQIFWPGVLLSVSGVAWMFYRRLAGRWTLAAWFLTSYVFWSAVSNKNDRYFLPALVVLPLAAASLPRRIGIAAAVVMVLFSAWTTWTPAGWALARPARPGVWPLEEIVRAVDEFRDPRSPLPMVALVSNHESLNGNNLRWTIERMGLGSRIVSRTKLERLGQHSEFVLVKTGDLGPAYAIHRQASARDEALAVGGWFAKAFGVVRRWPLPDGGEALLFRRKGPAAPDGGPASITQALFQGLVPGLEFDGLEVTAAGSRSYPGETEVRLSARRLAAKGLILTDVDATLDGFLAVLDDNGQSRLLRLRALRVNSARFSETNAAKFLAIKAKFLKNLRMSFFGKNRFEASGEAGPVRVTLSGRLSYEEAVPHPKVAVALDRFGVGPFRVPLPDFTAVLKPHPGMPFHASLSGLRTGRSEDAAVLEVAP